VLSLAGGLDAHIGQIGIGPPGVQGLVHDPFDPLAKHA
jgi:hypothetical protein